MSTNFKSKTYDVEITEHVQYWWKQDILHREELPAVTYGIYGDITGCQYWYLDGENIAESSEDTNYLRKDYEKKGR